MKKYLLLVGLLFITNLVLADCFFDGSSCYIKLDKDKVKELLGLTKEETSNSEAYNDVVSHLKERYSIDIENNIEHITLYIYMGRRNNDYIVVVNGNFDAEKMQSSIEKVMKEEKWRYQRIEDIAISDNKYKALKADGFLNIVFYDRNTIILSTKYIENNSVKLSKIPDSISKLGQSTNNFFYVNKEIFPILPKAIGISDNIGLEKANFLLCYIKDGKLCFEIDFNDSSTSKEVIGKIENISKEQIAKLKQNLNSTLEKVQKEIADSKDTFTANTFNFILQSLYFSKSNDFLNDLDVKQNGNSVIVSCIFNWDQMSSIIIAFVYRIIETKREDEIRSKCKWDNMYDIKIAVEKYNKEHKDNKMTTLDIKALVKEKYMSKEPIILGSECEYYLTEDGSIACKKHGKY